MSRNFNPTKSERSAAEKNQTRQQFPSDLSDDQWNDVLAFLPEEPPRGRHRSTDLREIVDAINYRWCTGCAWRHLPSRFPPWPTVYTYFRNWLKDGTLRQLRGTLDPPRPSQLTRRQA
ncbi:transposase [Calycomorphotria hydatis]|nr:transposase [Calycomorphotria hydatis]